MTSHEFCGYCDADHQQLLANLRSMCIPSNASVQGGMLEDSALPLHWLLHEVLQLGQTSFRLSTAS